MSLPATAAAAAAGGGGGGGYLRVTHVLAQGTLLVEISLQCRHLVGITACLPSGVGSAVIRFTDACQKLFFVLLNPNQRLVRDRGRMEWVDNSHRTRQGERERQKGQNVCTRAHTRKLVIRHVRA